MRILAIVLLLSPAFAQDLRQEAKAGLLQATAFFHQQVAVEGGYVYQVSHDLAKREGEGKVERDRVWVQPPGTPTVGEAFIEAWKLTGEEPCRRAARDAVAVLLRGQLASGGWNASIHLDPSERRKHKYRVDANSSAKARNHSSLDDDKTTAALRCLMRYDQAAAFKDAEVAEAVAFALDSLLAAQHPSGGWPQVYSAPADAKAPVRRASYPQPGAQATRVKAYWDHLTLNDNNIANAIHTLLVAHEIYGVRDGDKYQKSALKAGDFLCLAQMPAPQPGWAQQYDAKMVPAWARKFEPAAITGGESQAVMNTLLDLFEATGETRFLGPHKTAIPYYRASLLPDGRLARFYELKTNRPLYMTRTYELTYKDDDLPTHYSFKVKSRLDSIERRWRKLTDEAWQAAEAKKVAAPDEKRVRRLLDALDHRGAWVEDGGLKYWGKGDSTKRVIRSDTFASNLVLLARFVGSVPR